MAKNWMGIGCILAGLGVAAGAFGTHALQGAVPDDLLVVFATAARYQMTHAVALLFVGLAASRWPDHRWDIAGMLFTSGTIVFSGSLYVLALTGARWLGAITPIGGACLLTGWFVAALAANRTATVPDEVEARDGAA